MLCLAITASMTASLLAMIWMTPYPPFQDFMEWVYQSEWIRRMLLGEGADFLRFRHYPVPYSASQVIMAGMCFVLPPLVVARLFLTVFLGGALAVSFALARSYRPEHWIPLGATLFVVVFVNNTFWNGNSNYYLGMLGIGTYLLLERRQPEATVWHVAVFGIITFFCHALIFLPFAVMVVFQNLDFRRLLRVGLALSPCMVLGIAYVLLRPRAERPATELDHGSLLQFLAYKTYSLSKAGGYHNFLFADGGDAISAPWRYRIGIAWNLLYTVIFGLGLAAALRTGVPRDPVTRPLVYAATLLIFGFLVIPSVWLDVINAGERLLYPGVLLLFLILPFPRFFFAASQGAMVATILCIVLFLGSPHDWFGKAARFDLKGKSTLLYTHRPNTNAKEVLALRDTPGNRPLPQLRIPFSFSSSIIEPLHPSASEDEDAPAE